MRFIRDTVVTFSTQIGIVLAAVVVSIVIARVLGPSGKGSFALIILVPTVLVSLGNLGIGISNVYFGGSRKYQPAELAANSVVAALGFGILLSGAFLAYYHTVRPSFLADADPLCLTLVVLMLPFSLIALYFAQLLLGQQKIVQYNSVALSHNLVLFLLVLVLLLGAGTGLLGACSAWAVAVLLSAFLAFLLVRRLTVIKWSFHPALFKHTVKFGVQGYLGNVIQLLNYRLDMFLIVFYMSTAAVGYYSVAVGLVEALWYFPAAVGVVIISRVPGLSAEEANKSTPVICRNTLFITLIVGALLFALAKYIIPLLFGAAFLSAVRPLQILLPGIVALSICKVLSNEITGRGRPIINTAAAATSLAVNIPLNILFIPMWGISGAALASTISYTLTAIVVLVAFMRISKNSLFDTLIIKPQDLKIYTDVLAKGWSLAFGRR